MPRLEEEEKDEPPRKGLR